MMLPIKTIAVLLTCFNRRVTTLACLARMYAQDLPEGIQFKVFLVDDGCSDGTGDAVRAAYPDVNIIEGTGSLFWCNGMRLAWEHAAKESPDFYLWLNDDTVLLKGAIYKLLTTYGVVVGQKKELCKGQPEGNRFADLHSLATDELSIVVGSCCDPQTGKHTYGGQIRTGRHPGKLEKVVPGDAPIPCDTFQGNMVLVPRAVYQKIGNMRSFSHAMGDTDYGYRAKRAGCSIWVTPGFVGMCDLNTKENIDQLGNTPLRHRLKVVAKRIPPRDWFRFLWLHAGMRSFLYWPMVYIRVALKLN